MLLEARRQKEETGGRPTVLRAVSVTTSCTLSLHRPASVALVFKTEMGAAQVISHITAAVK